jgi:hypothetical protein
VSVKDYLRFSRAGHTRLAGGFCDALPGNPDISRLDFVRYRISASHDSSLGSGAGSREGIENRIASERKKPDQPSG